MKLLLWAPMGVGTHYHGAGTAMYRLLRAHPRNEWSITLVHGCEEQANYDLFDEQVFLSSLNPASSLRQVVFLREARKWLASRSFDFDVFFGIDAYESTVRPAAWAFERDLPVVIRPASYQSGIASGSYLSKIMGLHARRRKALRRFSAVVAISNAIKDSLLKVGCEETRIHYIPNGVDTEVYRPSAQEEKRELREKLGWSINYPVILFVGGVSERKNPGWIVEALYYLNERGMRVAAAFVGPERVPGHRASVAQKAEKLGVSAQIWWHGQVDDVAEYYRAADFFCLPSAREGMPNALLEAMASGLPSLATPISGCEDIIDHGDNGMFVESSLDIADRLSELMQDEAACAAMGRKSRRVVRKRFASESTWTKYEHLLSNIARG